MAASPPKGSNSESGLLALGSFSLSSCEESHYLHNNSDC